MKKLVVSMVFALFAMLFLTSCGTTPVVRIRIPGPQGYHQGGPPRQYAGDGHHGPPGFYQGSPEEMERFGGRGPQGPPRGEPRIVDGGKGEYSRTKWQNGIDRHGFHVQATISAFNNALPREERPAWGKKLEDWAAKVYENSGKTHIPSDEEATEELCRLLGHKNVRVKLEDRVSNEFISQERTLVSREKVNESEVPRESVAELQKKAIEQFKTKGTNEMVTDGRFYKN